MKTARVNFKHAPTGPDHDCIKVDRSKWDEVPELDETVKVTDGEREEIGYIERIQNDRFYVCI